jgi:hypothetical protein
MPPKKKGSGKKKKKAAKPVVDVAKVIGSVRCAIIA